jgi:hypothetical protein
MNDQTTKTVRVLAQVHSKDSLFFRAAGADATDPNTGERFECSTNVGTGSPIIKMPDGRWVTFTWEALIYAAREACKE